MSTRVVISDKALREMVREALDGAGWSGTDNAEPVRVNAITDPSSAVTDPVNPNFTPQDKTEFGVAMQQLVKNLPDTDMPTVFTAVKTALDRRSEKDEIDAANQAAMVAGSQEAIDAAGKSGEDTKKQEGKMPTMSKVEEQLRARIRKAILEAQGLTEADLPPVKKIPMGVHGGEFNRRHEKTKADLRKSLGTAVDRYENEPEAEPDLSDEEGGEEEHKPKHAHQEIGALGQVGNASFEDIAKETGMSVSGAKQAVDKSLLRFKFLYQLPEDDREILVLTAMNDYIDTLNKTGELTAADVQLLKDHPDIVRELDGFRDFLHNTVRRAMKGEAKLEDPLGESDDALDEEDIEMTSVAGKDKSKPQAPRGAAPSGGKEVKMASGKKATVDWGGFDEGKRIKSPLLAEAATIVMADNKGPYVIADGVEARPSNPNRTQYRSGTKVNVHRRGKKGVFIVEMPNGEQWTNKKLQESPRPKGQAVIAEANPAAMTRKRKAARPDLYCPKCLWMTGGGPCHRHGGPPWTEERAQAARAKSRGEV